MKTDITTKLLLAALTGALWVIALRPVVQPQPVQAQSAPSWVTPALDVANDGIYVAAPSGQSGQVYRFGSSKLGAPQNVGAYGTR